MDSTLDAEGLAARIGCKPSAIKPCLLEAFRLPPARYENRKFAHAITYLVGSEVLSIAPTAKAARALFIAWGREKGIEAGKVQGLLEWFGSNAWSRKGCRADEYVKRLCPGRKRCEWYSRGPWRDRTPTKDCELKTFYVRNWPAALAERVGSRRGHQAVRMYQGLCAFEKEHKLRPGARLFFTKAAGRAFCENMRDDVQREALLALREAGLVRIPSWGRKRTKGKPNQARTVRRVVPVPFI